MDLYEDPHKQLESNIPGYIYYPIMNGTKNIISAKEIARGAVLTRFSVVKEYVTPIVSSRITYVKDAVIPPLVNGTQKIIDVKSAAQVAVKTRYSEIRDYASRIFVTRYSFVKDALVPKVLAKIASFANIFKTAKNMSLKIVSDSRSFVFKYYDRVKRFALAKFNWAMSIVGYKQKKH